MHDNVPSYSAKKTNEYINEMDLKDIHAMKWPSYSPDFNQAEKIYIDVRRFTRIDQLWNAILDANHDRI